MEVVAWVWGGGCVCAEAGGGTGVFVVASVIGLVIGGVCVVLFFITRFIPAFSSASV